MKVSSLNINGLVEKEDELRLFVKEHKPDILFLLETKTRSSELKFRLNYPGNRYLKIKTIIILTDITTPVYDINE